MRSYEDNQAHSRPSLTQFASIFDTSLHFVQKWDTNCFQVATQVLTAPDCFSFEAIGYFDLVKKCFFTHTHTLSTFLIFLIMTKQEKQMFRYWIVRNDMQNRFDFSKCFFELDWYDINKLAHYAEIFRVRTTQNGWSPARNLWNQLIKSHDKYLKIK